MIIKGRFLSEWLDWLVDPFARLYFKFYLKKEYPSLYKTLQEIK